MARRPHCTMASTAARRARALAIAAAVLAVLASPLAAQVDLGNLKVTKPAGRAEPKVKIAAEFTAPSAADPARLFITATIEPQWHIYSTTQKPPGPNGGPIKTKIKLDASDQFKLAGDFQPSPEPKRYVDPAFNLDVETFENTVTWTAPIELAAGADPQKLAIAGKVSLQVCRDEEGCLQETHPFEARLGKGVTLTAAPASGGPAPNGARGAETSADSLDLSRIRVQGDEREEPLVLMVGFALLGGLILNAMPCVLPVIGLKILGFVEQSGQSRRHVFLLNWWFSIGLLAVFVAMATILIVYRIVQGRAFGWGQQNAYDAFNITMTAIVFVMALSLLGVWEIPIPGFLGSGSAGSLAAKEGITGAFLKGAITTLLAIPCTGPFLGTAVAFAAGRPPEIVYLMFVAMGLGMASPYLLIGAFPRLIRFLPKPGAWMETFKQAMGFVLLATVVYLMTLLEWAAVIPTLALLMGLWAGCWWIGRTPVYAELGAKLGAWAGGAVLAAATGALAFFVVGPIMQSRFERTVDRFISERVSEAGKGATSAQATSQAPANARELPWQAFSAAKLDELTRQQKTVMVDFTADWCWTCKTLERIALNTQDTYDVVAANGVVPLVADMTRYPEEESKLLEALNNGGLGVPVLAIFPAGSPNRPIVLRGWYSLGTLLERLHEAGPSKSSAGAESTAMNQ